MERRSSLELPDLPDFDSFPPIYESNNDVVVPPYIPQSPSSISLPEFTLSADDMFEISKSNYSTDYQQNIISPLFVPQLSTLNFLQSLELQSINLQSETNKNSEESVVSNSNELSLIPISLPNSSNVPITPVMIENEQPPKTPVMNEDEQPPRTLQTIEEEQPKTPQLIEDIQPKTPSMIDQILENNPINPVSPKQVLYEIPGTPKTPESFPNQELKKDNENIILTKENQQYTSDSIYEEEQKKSSKDKENEQTEVKENKKPVKKETKILEKIDLDDIEKPNQKQKDDGGEEVKNLAISQWISIFRLWKGLIPYYNYEKSTCFYLLLSEKNKVHQCPNKQSWRSLYCDVHGDATLLDSGNGYCLDRREGQLILLATKEYNSGDIIEICNGKVTNSDNKFPYLSIWNNGKEQKLYKNLLFKHGLYTVKKQVNKHVGYTANCSYRNINIPIYKKRDLSHVLRFKALVCKLPIKVGAYIIIDLNEDNDFSNNTMQQDSINFVFDIGSDGYSAHSAKFSN
jgi:hypothetical protein